MTSPSIRITIGIPCLLRGGTEAHVLDLIRSLSSTGSNRMDMAQPSYGSLPAIFFTVVCYFESNPQVVRDFQDAGAEVILLGFARAKSPFSVLLGLQRTFREVPADLVHIQYMAPGFLAVLAARLAGIRRVVATVHQSGRPHGWWPRLLIRTAARMCSSFYCNSVATQTSWFEAQRPYNPSADSPPKGIFTVYNAVDEHLIQRSVSHPDAPGLRMRHGLGGGPVIGIVGRLRHEKGQDIGIRAMPEIIREYPTAHLLVVGDGPDRVRLQTLVADLNLLTHVSFTGEMTREQAWNTFSVMNVLMVPSRSEGFGLVAIEAMAAGIPLVVADIDGLPEVVDHGRAGLLATPEDPKAFAQAVLNVLRNCRFREQLVQNGRERVRGLFSFDRFRQVWGSIYADTLRQ